MLKICFNLSNVKEKLYIIETIFKDFLGLNYFTEIDNELKSYEITLSNNNILVIDDNFFNKFSNSFEYLKKENIPTNISYTKNDFIVEKDIPIIFGTNKIEEINYDNYKKLTCGIDIFASTFFMITRWEEYVSNVRDKYDRFIGKESIAYKNGFIDRPIVNEYIEMLWNMLKYLGIKQERKKKQFNFLLTHDIDHPFHIVGTNFLDQIKSIASDIIRKKNFNNAINKTISIFLNNEQKLKYDDYNTFDFIMDLDEKYNLKSSFYFLPKGSPEQYYNHDIDSFIIIKLIKKIIERGHEIGIHGHIKTYKNKDNFLNDVSYFNNILQKYDINYKIKGGRQHYLRFDIPNTFYNYEEAGLEYDSSLGYFDIAGFRCGTCYEFRPFDFIKGKTINIIEKPLIVMEGTVIQYMNLGISLKSVDYILELKNKCKKYNGIFVLLWHNSFLTNNKEKKMYEIIIKNI